MRGVDGHLLTSRLNWLSFFFTAGVGGVVSGPRGRGGGVTHPQGAPHSTRTPSPGDRIIMITVASLAPSPGLYGKMSKHQGC